MYGSFRPPAVQKFPKITQLYVRLYCVLFSTVFCSKFSITSKLEFPRFFLGKLYCTFLDYRIFFQFPIMIHLQNSSRLIEVIKNFLKQLCYWWKEQIFSFHLIPLRSNFIRSLDGVSPKCTVENVTNSTWSCKVVWFLAGHDSSVLSKITQPFTIIAY